MGAQDLVTVVSSMMHGEYGIEGMCLSMRLLSAVRV